MPTARSIQVDVDNAHLVINLLPLHDAPRRPKTRRDRHLLKKADFYVRSNKAFVFGGRRRDYRKPFRLVYHLAVRKGADKVVAIDTPKESRIV